MTSKTTANRRVPRASRTGWVPIALMRVSEPAQRELNRAHVNDLVLEFDPEKVGVLVVSKRDGVFYIIDGNHRKHALEGVGWGDQQVQCEIYEGLTEAEEAEMFLGRNKRLSVTALASFRVSVTAGRATEVAIDKIVRSADLKVGAGAGNIQAVGTIIRIYDKFGPDILARSLAIVRDAFGIPGLEGPVIEAAAMVLHRYGADITDEAATTRLKAHRGGIGAIVTAAEAQHVSLGYARQQCLAAALVIAYNKAPGPRGFKKLAAWFRDESADGRNRALALAAGA